MKNKATSADKKFRPLRTTNITCSKCGHIGKLKINELELNRTRVNYVAKIRHGARNAALEEAAEVCDWQVDVQSKVGDKRAKQTALFLAREIRQLKAGDGL